MKLILIIHKNDKFSNLGLFKRLHKDKGSGICKACLKSVHWARERVAAHKRTNCPSASSEEKKMFAKRSHESSSQLTIIQSNSHLSQPSALSSDSTSQKENQNTHWRNKEKY
ncbi:hypothetical protein PVAND_001017 [Polypedilum vanderplanki]|uniref:Uncharacterized protein n=1 Tax=Polypedilum vanderplanki TaxID=319348 RepID=A0A9J6BLM8_POLVA|nr:hypothetical protein PVAND_001017 [Polypedilum vanderplanki]